MADPSSPRNRPYAQALRNLSARTGTPLSSLVVSFAVLHELTAVIPLFGFFYTARTLGIGERTVQAVRSSADNGDGQAHWLMEKARGWSDEGEKWAGRVGTRYGIWGFEKRTRQERQEDEPRIAMPQNIAGDVANAIVAYGATKVGTRHFGFDHR